MRRGRPPATDIQALRERFEGQVRTVAAAAHASGEVAKDDLEQLDDLHRLLAHAEALPRRQLAPRILPAALFLVLLSLLSVALFHHLARCQVELDLTVSRLGFQLDREQALFDPLALAALALRRSGRLEILPDIRAAADVSLRPVVPAAGQITLGPLRLPAATRVDLEACTRAQPCAIGLGGQEIEISGSLKGRFLLETAGAQTTLDVPSARGLRLLGNPSGLTVEAALAPGQSWQPLANLHVHGFTLDQLSEHPTPGAGYARPLSALKRGAIRFTDLPGLHRTLRRRERIDIDFDGWIDELSFAQGSLRLIASGTANRIQSASGEERQDLMPTELDWWRQRHGLSLLWGSTIYLFTLALALLRWWQEEKKSRAGV
jgi:hypothetical protein